MKKLSAIGIFVFLLSLAGPAPAWEGRMAGMADPYGLVGDPADFLIHPAKVAEGEGVRFLSFYRYAYSDVPDWNYRFDYTTELSSAPGGINAFSVYEASGDIQRHNARLGSAFPIGTGRMAILFSYDDEAGEYDGTHGSENGLLGDSLDMDFKLESGIENYAFTIYYGVPVNTVSLGLSVGMVHRSEEKGTGAAIEVADWEARNFPGGGFYPWWGSALDQQIVMLHHYLAPGDMEYWEGTAMASLSAKWDTSEVAITGRGGWIVSGENSLLYEQIYSGPGVVVMETEVDMEGDADGWSVGGDLWIRLGLGNGVSLPLLGRADYTKRETDMRARRSELTISIPEDFEYNHRQEEESLRVEGGGGIEKEWPGGSRIALGAYYQYIRTTTEIFWETLYDPAGYSRVYEYDKVPEWKEQRIRGRLAGEWAVSSAVALRLGVDGFFGWTDCSFDSRLAEHMGILSNSYPEQINLEGHHWGGDVTLGFSIVSGTLRIEPFVTGGYRKLDLDGDGSLDIEGWAPSTLPFSVDAEAEREELTIGGGISLVF